MTGNYGTTSGKPNYAARMIRTFSGPAATLKFCGLCKPTVEGVSQFTFRKGRGGGRGAGLGWGAGVTSKLSAHMRKCHPDAVALIAQPKPFYECDSEKTRADAHRNATITARDLAARTGVRDAIVWTDDGRRVGYTVEAR